MVNLNIVPEAGRNLCYMYTSGVGLQTWLKILEQALYLSYYLPYLHGTCMDGASGFTNDLKVLDAESLPWNSDAGGGFWRRFKFLEQVPFDGNF